MMSAPLFYAALLPPKPDIGEAILFMLAGIVLVMSVLSMMSLGTAGIGKIFIALSRREATATQQKQAQAEEERRTVAAAAAAVAAVTSPAQAGNPHLVAVIAAAAHATLGSSARVVSIRPAENEWGAEGRRQIFASHRTR